MFLVTIDAFSKWIDVKHMFNITTIIMVLFEYFAVWIIPKKLVVDNETSLCSFEKDEFLRNNGGKTKIELMEF